MNPNPHLPTSWPSFQRHLKSDVRDETTQAVFDFQARYRFARSFKGVNVEGYSPAGSTVDGYSALMKILFVCAAMEQLCKVLGKKPIDVSIIAPAVAKRVRDELYGNGDTRFVNSLRKCKSYDNGKHLVPLWSGTSDDVRPFFTTLRNGIAHGHFTPAGLTLDGIGRKEILLDLADAVLADTDQRFTEWVEADITRRWLPGHVEPPEETTR